jgi:hypothetical protein
MVLAIADGGGPADQRRQSVNNLKQIVLAMHQYHDTNKHFPPPAINGKDGKPLLSWRVAILPYLDQIELYQRFKLDEPWDSPHNLKASQTVVQVYQSPGVKTDKPYLTYYHIFVSKPGTSPSAMFRPDRKTTIVQVRDGTSNTIAVIEAGKPVPWAKPEDIPFDPKQQLPMLTSPRKDGLLLAGFADGSVRSIRQNIPTNLLKALITCDGAEADDTSAFVK